MPETPVSVVFVCDSNFDRQSASPETARLMVRSVKHYHPEWGVFAGVVGDPPAWLEEEGVRWVPVIPPDQQLRFLNKVEALRVLGPAVVDHHMAQGVGGDGGGYTLFLDGDVLMCRRMDVGKLAMRCVGVHSDYPNESTRDWVGRQVYGACGVRFPPTRAQCTMYGGETWITLNVGAFWLVSQDVADVAALWLENAHKVKDVLRGNVRTFSEQTALMPTLDKLGIGFQLLSAAYNWNGTIYPTTDCPKITGEEVVFLHYHRTDILSSDPAAQRVLAEMGVS